MPLAPIALFVFKRPEETRLTLEHLFRNPELAESELFVFCDAARRPDEQAAVQATRNIVRSRAWCPRLTIIEREKNTGLAKSIIAGVSQLVDSHGKVIVFEDDLLASHGTLRFFNEALDCYENEDQVMQISGHTLSVPGLGNPADSFFLPLTTSWGWATWARAWKHFDATTPGWERLATDAGLRYRFDLDGSYFFAEMMEKQHAGKVDSWAVCWRWAMFQREGLTLYPRQTLIKNVGFGAAATHTSEASGWLAAPDWTADHAIETFPKTVKTDEMSWAKIKAFYRKANFPPLLVRILRRLKRAFRQPTSA
jgi:hypothetical protein